tara:strand:+ start:10586 stop:10999 length:414 start_codon:yes stop_codon:yes gene_type:complete
MKDTEMNLNPCHICRLTGGGHDVVDGINSYIVDNVGSVQMHEIIRQVHDVLKDEDLEMSHEDIQNHIMHHVKNQKVIMNTVLSDLLSMSHLTKKASVVECDETGTKMVDNKMMTIYLKIVDQIITVYRMDSMKEAKS